MATNEQEQIYEALYSFLKNKANQYLKRHIGSKTGIEGFIRWQLPTTLDKHTCWTIIDTINTPLLYQSTKNAHNGSHDLGDPQTPKSPYEVHTIQFNVQSTNIQHIYWTVYEMETKTEYGNAAITDYEWTDLQLLDKLEQTIKNYANK